MDRIRNPFGVADAPDPGAADVLEFAATHSLDGSQSDSNANSWPSAPATATDATSLAGSWSSRWNGGADPTIAGDASNAWKAGRATLAVHHDRIYVLFDWNHGARQGLLEAIRDGIRWHGRYINLSNPSIARPWAGILIDSTRIDGCWTNGRLDFRR